MMEKSNVLLQVEGLEVVYSRSVRAVQDVTLEVNSGEIVALIGPNGAGKTTTLRGIGGFADHEHAEITKGSIIVNGTDITKKSPQQRARMGVGIVPESNKIFERLTVSEHFRAMFSSSKDPEQEKILQLFPRLTKRWSELSGLLSGGERQMLGIAVTLARKPSILLIDELSLGLAPKIFDELLEKLLEVRESEKVGILLVEQNVDRAIEVSDRCYFISSGRIGRSDFSKNLLESSEIWDFMMGEERPKEER